IQVKQTGARSNWIWGAFKMPGRVLHELYDLWREPGRRDEYIGTLVNEYLARGGRAEGVRAGEAYVDVGTLNGYREAIKLLGSRPLPPSGKPIPARAHAPPAAMPGGKLARFPLPGTARGWLAEAENLESRVESPAPSPPGKGLG